MTPPHEVGDLTFDFGSGRAVLGLPRRIALTDAVALQGSLVARGQLETIRDNYYFGYVVGIDRNLESLACGPDDEFWWEAAFDTYVEWVARLLPEYV